MHQENAAASRVQCNGQTDVRELETDNGANLVSYERHQRIFNHYIKKIPSWLLRSLPKEPYAVNGIEIIWIQLRKNLTCVSSSFDFNGNTCTNQDCRL